MSVQRHLAQGAAQGNNGYSQIGQSQTHMSPGHNHTLSHKVRKYNNDAKHIFSSG